MLVGVAHPLEAFYFINWPTCAKICNSALQCSVSSSKTFNNFSGEGDHIMSVLEDSNREREELRQKCHELEIQVKLLTENKSIMTTELDNLQVQVKGKIEAESYR